MDFSIVVVNLAGWVALLLWGTRMVQTGIQRAYGARLRSFLGAALNNRFQGFLAGFGVTTLLQSSTATGLMITGLAAGGLVGLMPALAVMLGANVGSTLIVQVLSFNIVAVSPVLILVGVLLFRRDSASELHDLGRVFIGLGLMLLALHQLIVFLAPLKDLPDVRTLLGLVSDVPVLDVFLAAAITWAVHSSVAVVLLVMSLATQGVIPAETAFAFVLGANLGTAINPVLEATSGDDPVSRRVPLGNLLMRGAGVLIALLLLEPAGRVLLELGSDAGRAVANFHTLFNVVVAALFFPLLGPCARFLGWLLPNRTDPADPSRPLYLDAAAKETPIIALGGAAREALRLADFLAEMLRGAREALKTGDRRLIGDTRRQDDVLDRLNMAIKTYLTSIDPDELGPADHRRLNEVLTFATNLEQAGDVIDRTLLPHAAKRLKRGIEFSAEGEGELLAMMDRLMANLRTAASLFMTEDSRAARVLAEEKVAFRDAEAEATMTHFDRLRSGRIDSAETSSLHLDLLRDMKQINSHIIAAAAYPVLERTGELLRSRLLKNVS
jgi:phosphate:Na+ symporter